LSRRHSRPAAVFNICLFVHFTSAKKVMQYQAFGCLSVCLPACLSVCLSLCLLASSCINYLPDLHENFTKDASVEKEERLNFGSYSLVHHEVPKTEKKTSTVAYQSHPQHYILVQQMAPRDFDVRLKLVRAEGQYWAGRTPPPNNGPPNMAAANFVVITNGEGCAFNGTAVAAMLINQ